MPHQARLWCCGPRRAPAQRPLPASPVPSLPPDQHHVVLTLPDGARHASVFSTLLILRVPFTQRLRQLPDQLAHLTLLERLDVSVNLIDDLPAWLPRLQQLRELVLRSNRFAHWPSVLLTLPLTELQLGNNKLTGLPAMPSSPCLLAESLQTLVLDDCPLAGLQDASLGRFTCLKQLSCQRCGLTELPDALGGLSKLEELHVESNLIQVLPDAMSGLINLQKLFLSHNKLRALPYHVIGSLRALTHLYADSNELDTLPPSIDKCVRLRYLCLAYNQLRHLPMELCSLSSLGHLFLDGNKLTYLPASLGRVRLDGLTVCNNQLRALPITMASATFYFASASNPWMSDRSTEKDNLALAAAVDAVPPLADLAATAALQIHSVPEINDMLLPREVQQRCSRYNQCTHCGMLFVEQPVMRFPATGPRSYNGIPLMDIVRPTCDRASRS